MNPVKIQQSSVIRTSRGLTVAGTRITLYSIMDYVKAGKSPEVIRDHFRLTIKQTNDVLDYIAQHQAEVETEYQQVLQEAEQERLYWEQRNREKFTQIEKLPDKPETEKLRAKLQESKAKLGLT